MQEGVGKRSARPEATREVGWRLYKGLLTIALLFILTGLMTVAVFFRDSDKRENELLLSIPSAYLGQEFFAIVGNGSSRSETLFFGSIEGEYRSAVKSDGVIRDPFISKSDRLIFVERDMSRDHPFRLISIDLNDAQQCAVLLESKQSISQPVEINSKSGSAILFYVGDFNPEAAGVSVTRARLATLQDQKVTIISGAEFMSGSRLTATESNLFMGSALVVYADNRTYQSDREKLLFQARLEGGVVDVELVSLESRFDRPVLSVTAVQATKKVVLQGIEKNPITGRMREVLQFSDGKESEYVGLVDDMNYSVPFVHSDSGNDLVVKLISMARGSYSTETPVYLTYAHERGVISERSILISAGKNVLHTNTCGRQ